MNVEETLKLESQSVGFTNLPLQDESSKQQNLNKSCAEQLSPSSLDENKIKSNKSTFSHVTSTISNYCLKLQHYNSSQNGFESSSDVSNGNSKNQTYPLSLGVTKIGRSESSQICILNKNISKNHACIELKETLTGDIETCVLWDTGSLNKSKINNKPLVSTNSEEKFNLSLNDIVQFGVIKFKFCKMNENERKEQEKHRNFLVDLNGFDFGNSSHLQEEEEENNSLSTTPNKTKSTSKIASLFEIQNTLDDTALINENPITEKLIEGEVKNGKNGTNGTDSENNHSNLRMYIADTESEDEENDLDETTNRNNKSNLNNTSCGADFHLEMSESLINQSTVSIGTKKSFIIPDTMAMDDDNESESNPSYRNGNKTDHDDDEEKVKDDLKINETEVSVKNIEVKKSIEKINETVKLDEDKIEEDESKSKPKILENNTFSDTIQITDTVPVECSPVKSPAKNDSPLKMLNGVTFNKKEDEAPVVESNESKTVSTNETCLVAHKNEDTLDNQQEKSEEKDIATIENKKVEKTPVKEMSTFNESEKSSDKVNGVSVSETVEVTTPVISQEKNMEKVPVEEKSTEEKSIEEKSTEEKSIESEEKLTNENKKEENTEVNSPVVSTAKIIVPDTPKAEALTSIMPVENVVDSFKKPIQTEQSKVELNNNYSRNLANDESIIINDEDDEHSATPTPTPTQTSMKESLSSSSSKEIILPTTILDVSINIEEKASNKEEALVETNMTEPTSDLTTNSAKSARGRNRKSNAKIESPLVENDLNTSSRSKRDTKGSRRSLRGGLDTSIPVEEEKVEAASEECKKDSQKQTPQKNEENNKEEIKKAEESEQKNEEVAQKNDDTLLVSEIIESKSVKENETDPLELAENEKSISTNGRGARRTAKKIDEKPAEESTRSRRLTRQILVPVEEKPDKNDKSKKRSLNASEIKPNEEESVLSTPDIKEKTTEENVEKKVTEEVKEAETKEEPKKASEALGRRSSLRVKNNLTNLNNIRETLKSKKNEGITEKKNVVSSKVADTTKEVNEEIEEDTSVAAKKRRKSTAVEQPVVEKKVGKKSKAELNSSAALSLAQNDTINEDADDESDEAAEENSAPKLIPKVNKKVKELPTNKNPKLTKNRRQTVAITSTTLAKVAESAAEVEETPEEATTKRAKRTAKEADTSVKVETATKQSKNKRLSLNQSKTTNGPINVTLNEETKPGRKKRVTKETTPTKNKADTYLYDDSDNDANSTLNKGKKTSRKKVSIEPQVDLVTAKDTTESVQTNISSKNKKTRKSNVNNESKQGMKTETETGTDGEELNKSATNKRVRKHKSKTNNSIANESNGQITEPTTPNPTPKLFFHSKGGTGSKPSTLSTKEIISPTKSPLSLTKSKNVSPQSSFKMTPSKKFKLHKAKSSSSENLNELSLSDNDTESKDVMTDLTGNNKKRKLPLSNSSTSIPAVKSPPAEVANSGVTSAPVENKEAENNAAATVTAKITRKPSIRKSAASTAPTQNTSTRSSRNNKAVSSTVKVMSSGFSLLDKHKQAVINLGGQIVTDVRECTHLITNKIRRTCKFLSCLGKGAFIVTSLWLDESAKSKMFLTPTNFILNDPQTEKRCKFSLQGSLNKAKSSPLFEGWKFLIIHDDENQEITCDETKTIIECANGEIITSLPKDENELTNCCIIYSDYAKYKQDKSSNASVDILKMTLDQFLDFVLKQTFDPLFKIDQQNDTNDA